MEGGIPETLVKTLAIFGLSSLIAGIASLPAQKRKMVQDMIEDKDIKALEDFEKKEMKDKESQKQSQQKQESSDENDEERKEFERLRKKFEGSDPKYYKES